MGFLRCVGYLVFISLGLFAVGRFVPDRWLNPASFPFALHQFEQNGKLYDRIRIKSWQNKVPDMSKICPKLMPAKKMRDFRNRLPEMIRETCIAELIHLVLPFLGLLCVRIWSGWGWLMALLYALGNQPFVWIQRYNRPKLMRVLGKLQKNVREDTHRGGKTIQCEL